MIGAWLERAAERIASRRKPDFVIGSPDEPYMLRWFVIPRNVLANVYLHRFLHSDEDRALHTHPWLFNASILISGRYIEHTPSGVRVLTAPAVKFRWGSAPHRVELIDGGEVWSLFITGPRVREWGFLCEKGFVHWRVFTAPHDSGQVGRGCD